MATHYSSDCKGDAEEEFFTFKENQFCYSEIGAQKKWKETMLLVLNGCKCFIQQQNHKEHVLCGLICGNHSWKPLRCFYETRNQDIGKLIKSIDRMSLTIFLAAPFLAVMGVASQRDLPLKSVDGDAHHSKIYLVYLINISIINSYGYIHNCSVNSQDWH